MNFSSKRRCPRGGGIFLGGGGGNQEEAARIFTVNIWEGQITLREEDSAIIILSHCTRHVYTPVFEETTSSKREKDPDRTPLQSNRYINFLFKYLIKGIFIRDDVARSMLTLSFNEILDLKRTHRYRDFLFLRRIFANIPWAFFQRKEEKWKKEVFHVSDFCTHNRYELDTPTIFYLVAFLRPFLPFSSLCVKYIYPRTIDKIRY